MGRNNNKQLRRKWDMRTKGRKTGKHQVEFDQDDLVTLKSIPGATPRRTGRGSPPRDVVC